MVLAGLLAGDIASAYVLPTEFILQILADKRRHLNIVDLSIQLTTELESQHAPAEDRVYLKNPERLRRVRQDEETTTVEIVREGKAARGPEGDIKRVKSTPDILPVLLMPVGASIEEMQVRMTKAVKALGIDTSVTALGRYEDRVCYIIGARAWEKNVSQLWIDKETFLPLRLVLMDNKVRRETRWLEFGSSVTADWYPRVIEILEDGVRVERAEVTKIEMNKKVPETLFELP